MNEERPCVVITGHHSGIGKSVASALARLNAVVVIKHEALTNELKIIAVDELVEFPAEAYRRRKGKGERKRNRANRYR